MRSLILVTLVACSTPSTPLSSKPAPTPTPTGPAPTIEWGKRGHSVGLPAIASDGSVVVMGVIQEDGARGYTNLAIVVKDRNDGAAKTSWVMKSDEFEKLVGEGGPVPELVARIAAANQQLAELHAKYALVPIAELAVGDEHKAATGQGLIVGFTENTLAVSRGGNQVLAKPTPAAWLPKDSKMCPTCSEVCHNPGFLGGAWASAERSVAIVKVSYKGTDSCWEPPSEYHVVAW